MQTINPADQIPAKGWKAAVVVGAIALGGAVL
jgi:hypothetical protein